MPFPSEQHLKTYPFFPYPVHPANLYNFSSYTCNSILYLFILRTYLRYCFHTFKFLIFSISTFTKPHKYSIYKHISVAMIRL